MTECDSLDVANVGKIQGEGYLVLLYSKTGSDDSNPTTNANHHNHNHQLGSALRVRFATLRGSRG